MVPPCTIEKAMSKITKGTTTKEEVRGLLGDPGGVYKNSNGTEMWTYSSSDLNKKIAGRTGSLMVAGGAATAAGYFIPIVGPAIGILTMGKIATTPPPTITIESATINFNSDGIVSSVSTSTQKIGS